MNFTQIKGQEQAIQILKRALASNHLAHAYLFVGPQGVGKKLAALALAKSLNCQNPDSITHEGCNICADCVKMDSLTHPDLILIEPDGSSIKIEQVRALNSKVFFRCYEGTYKVIIINDAHLLTTEGANSLLKTLEEPAEHTVFILITSQAQSLPSTIISRCQHIQFRPLSNKDIEDILMDTYPQWTDQIPLVATLSRGSLSTAVNMLSTEELMDNRRELFDLLSRLSNLSISDILFWCEKWDKDKRNAKIMLELTQFWFRDLLIWHTTKDTNLLINVDYLSIFNQHNGNLTSIHTSLTLIQESLTKLEYNASPRLVMEMLLLKLKFI